MSVIQYGAQCEPGGYPVVEEIGWFSPAPTHIGCPGGYAVPGLIGGWTCPCDCHRDKSQTSTGVDAPPEERCSHTDAPSGSAGGGDR